MREPTAREKALQFAKNVPKPKSHAAVNQQKAQQDYPDGEDQENNIYEGAGDTGTQALHDQLREINELDAKHDYY